MANDRNRAIRIIRVARSAQAAVVTDQLPGIETPTLLIWGLDDLITPPDVAEAFLEQLPNAELHFIERCGHAPMLERPALFNKHALAFLHKTVDTTVLTPSGSTT